ncbi:MAG: hypothetical protein KDC76_00620 [Bacteroidetes bacterium]|nr:hypothetical protein [Bacteroidota bacterium]
MLGGGAGPISEMIAKIRYNRNLNLVRRERYARIKDEFNRTKLNLKLNLPEGSPEMREAIRREIIRHKKRTLIRNIIACCLGVFLTLVCLKNVLIYLF